MPHTHAGRLLHQPRTGPVPGGHPRLLPRRHRASWQSQQEHETGGFQPEVTEEEGTSESLDELVASKPHQELHGTTVVFAVSD